MPEVLSPQQITRYERAGAIAPVPIISQAEADSLRRRFGDWQPAPRRDMDPDCSSALDQAWDQYRSAMKAPYEQ